MEPVDIPRRPGAGPAEWGGLAVLALPTALLGLDVTLLYLALPALAADLRPSSIQALWIMDAYGFLIAGFLVTMGALGDRIGRRRLLVIGVAAFAAASVLAAFASTPAMLIAARAALGVAGAALMPSTLALIRTLFILPRERALAIGVWATMFALGMAAGPFVGGVLLERFWWGAAFLPAVPVAALPILAAPRLLPEDRNPAPGGRFDLISVALSLAAMLSAIYGVKEGTRHGPTPEALLALAAGITSGVIFVRRQRRLPSPLLDIRLFASGRFGVALGVLLVGLIGVGGAMLLVTQYLQLVAGLAPATAGMLMGAPAIAMLLAGIAAPLIARHVRTGFVMAAALGLSSLGYALLACLDAVPGVALAVTGYALVYLGLGAIAALGTDLVVGSAPPEKAGSASAISETVQELGIAVGVATLGSLASAVYRGQIRGQIPADLPEPAVSAVMDSLWAALSIEDSLPAGLPEAARAAFASGLSAAAWVSAGGIAFLSVLSAVALRNLGTIDDGGDPEARDPKA